MFYSSAFPATFRLTTIFTAGVGAATTAASITFGLGAVAIISALSSIMGAFNSAAEDAKTTPLGDGVISPSGGLLISGPKGSFISDPSDKLLLSPDADKLVGGGGGGITKADLDAIINRPIIVNVQANTDTLLRLQTAQSQNSSNNLFA